MENRCFRGNSGFIMVLTLMFMALFVILITRIFEQGTAYCALAKTTIAREKARQIALGGVQLALSKLTKGEEAETEEKDKKDVRSGASQPKAKSEHEINKEFLARILPGLNRWRTFQLKEELDGIDGEVKICMMCEDGKININRLYDFKNKQFLLAEGDDQEPSAERELRRAIATGMERFEKATGAEYFVKSLESFFESRERTLDDVTELLGDKKFAPIDKFVFYHPPDEIPEDGKQRMYLTDLFTTWSAGGKMNPWLLSDSMRAWIGLKRVGGKFTEDDKKNVELVVEGFAQENKAFALGKDKAFEALYGKCTKDMERFCSIAFNTKFEFKSFSVLSCGKVGSVVQKLFAIIEKSKPAQGGGMHFEVRKLYWL